MYHLELQNRYRNPKWIHAMMDHGYDGARYMDAFTGDLFLWNITSPEMVKTEDWNQVYATYLEDKNHLGLQTYFNQKNPYVQQSMVATMLEAAEKGYWKATDQQLTEMAKTLTGSVAQNDAACNMAVCNSPGLTTYITKIMEKAPGVSGTLQNYKTRLAQLKTTGKAPAGTATPSASLPVTGREITIQQPAVASSPGSHWPFFAGLVFLIVLFAAGFLIQDIGFIKL